MGQVQESLDWFHNALDLMSCRLPTGIPGRGLRLASLCFKQYLHMKFPNHYIDQVEGSNGFQDKARCLTHLVHAYNLVDRKEFSLIPALTLLNSAEEARDFCVHEVRDITHQ